MSSANPLVTTATAAPRPTTPMSATSSPMPDLPATNGHPPHSHENRPAPAPPVVMGKKGKQKKATEPNEASKLIAARISQLELDAAGEKDQEAEIGAFCPHAMGGG
jgi:hypothetical protein